MRLSLPASTPLWTAWLLVAALAAALCIVIAHFGMGWALLPVAAAGIAAWMILERRRVLQLREMAGYAVNAAAGNAGSRPPRTRGDLAAVADALEKLAASVQRAKAERDHLAQALRTTEQQHRLLAESAERKWRTSEERFRAFMGNNPAACWIMDEQGRIVYLNRALAEMLDAPEDELQGRSLFEVFPEDLARTYDEKNRQVLREGRVLEGVEQAPRRDGSQGHFAAFRFPLRDFDGREVVGGMAVDVTERIRMAEALRASEERFREFMDNNPALCWICDQGGRITYVNKSFVASQKLSLDPVGRHPIELFLSAIARAHQQGLRQVLEQGGPTETQEQLLRADGSSGDFTVFRFPLVAMDGRRSVGGVAIDITDRLRAANELKAANLRLQALSNRIIEVQESERRQIARELHDEIGQCLTALKINLEGLQRAIKDPAVLGRIGESVELSAHTLAQVRRLSVDLRPSQLDDLGLEPALRSILGRQAAIGGFDGHYEARLEGVKLSDQVETACFRVCQEALTNIVKHGRARNVWVTVESSENRLHLCVRDDGKGFDPALGRQRAAAGQSFGLLGMQERASLAGGHIEIDSTPGKGTEVRAWFAIGSGSTDEQHENHQDRIGG